MAAASQKHPGNRIRRALNHISWKKAGITLAITAGILFVLCLGILWYLLASAPDIDEISVSPKESATYICDSNGTRLRKLTYSSSNRDIVTLSQIPDTLQHAVIAIEDARFYEHGGIDVRGIFRAAWTGLSSGSFSEGASTITQQLIKNQVFTEWTQERSFWDRLSRKVQEQYLALQLEDRMDKSEILEDYLNTVNFGSGCYGVQAASRRYFGKNVSELVLSESAVLASILQNPTGYNPLLHPEANRTRQQIILRYMQEQGYISEEDAHTAAQDPVYDRILDYDETYTEDQIYSYYEDALIDQAVDALVSEKHYSEEQARHAIFSGGLRIYSAQDSTLQTLCENVFSDPANFPSNTEPDEGQASVPQPQASLVLMEQSTGLVRAIVGGRGEKPGSLTLNRAVDTTRQPGSTFKILTAYAPALDDANQTLATLYENTPYQYPDGTPVSNWQKNDYTGPVTIREAITRSINVIAVKCLEQISPELGFSYAQKFGISTLIDSDSSDSSGASDVILPLALGGVTHGVTNLELCNAYASIADGGIYHTPRFFTKILDRHGNVLIDHTASSGTRILKESTAFLLTSAMQDVVSAPTGTAYGAIQAAGLPVAGKTGTTSSYKDIWFAGYTPYYTCCVWGGYDNNQTLPDGDLYHTYAKTLWSAVMNQVHAALPPASFTPPESIVAVSLCKNSHLPAVKDGCPDTYMEFFAAGTEPKTECPLHEPVPETEPIVIYPGILENLISESETQSETQSETNSEPGESENQFDESETPSEPDSVNPSQPDDESDLTEHTDTEASSESESDSLHDLIQRIYGSL